jgi:small-conductance mechanosensitive channel
MQIPELIRAIVEAQDGVRFDRAHFAKYGASSLDFEAVYYLLSPDYNRHMDVEQAIFFSIHEAFEREGIELAYPTQKLWLAQSASPAPAR